MSWPVSQDYNEAVQNPRTSFGDAELREAEAVANALGLPLPRSGNFADVYEFRRGESRWAVKCFTREVAGLRERYAEISGRLRRARLPFAVDFSYLEEGIRVRGRWHPVLKMRWVEGLLLNEFVRDHLDKPAQLAKLSALWRRMTARLREAGVAHGDLQHGNVLLVPGSRAASLALKLIDYDGMYVPALAGTASGEVGHPSYQHPQRLTEGTYGPEVDRFPLLVVAAALRCLTVGGRALWEPHDNGDNLLFRQTDLRAPEKSALFRELWRLPDAAAHALVGRLAVACAEPLDRVPLLEESFADETSFLGSEAHARAVALLGAEAVSVGVPPADFPPSPLHPQPLSPKGRGEEIRDRPTIPAVVWMWMALVVAALVVLFPLVFWLVPRRPRPTEPAGHAEVTLHEEPAETSRGETSPPPAPPPASPVSVGTKAKDLLAAAESATSNDDRQTVLADCLALVEAERAKDHYDDAHFLLTAAADKVARLVGDEAAVATVASLTKQTAELREEHARLTEALLALKGNDPKVLLKRGQFLCFCKGDWADGLRILRHAVPLELAYLAARDLESARASPEDKADLAARWWDLAEAEQDLRERNLRARARFWYREALPGLRDEARKRQAKERLTLRVGEEEYHPGLAAEYYRGLDFSDRVKRDVAPRVDFAWGQGTPPPPVADGPFSCRWTGYLIPPAPGAYRLLLEADMSVSHDSGLLKPRPGAGGRREVWLTLPADTPYHLVVDYRHKGAASPVRLLWARDGAFGERAVPDEALYHTRAQER